MKLISLGYSCYLKLLLKECGFNQPTNPFDWINSFRFSLLISSLENGMNIFDDVEPSKLHGEVDSRVLYNKTYQFRIPHDLEYYENKKNVVDKYKRRLDRLIQNSENSDCKYIYIRHINTYNHYGILGEDIQKEYGDSNFHRIEKFLSKNSIFVLLSHLKINEDIRSKISKNYILCDDALSPGQAIYIGDKKDQEKTKKLYAIFFEYLLNNFDLLKNKNENYVKKLNEIILKRK